MSILSYLVSGTIRKCKCDLSLKGGSLICIVDVIFWKLCKSERTQFDTNTFLILLNAHVNEVETIQ